MIRWSLILCIGLLLSTSVSAEVLSKIAVVVNDELIMTSEVDRELEKALQTAGAQPSEEERARLWSRMRGQMIENLLVRQRIAQLGIQVTEEDLNRAIEDIQEQNKMDRSQLEAALANEGVGWNAYRERMRKELLRLKLLQREVYSKVEVTNREVSDYFLERLDDYRLSPTVELRRITFPIPEGAQRMDVVDVRKKALYAQRDLRSGVAFDQVLTKVVEDQAGTGGDMGAVEIPGLNAQFADAIAPLKDGDVSELIETATAIHLLQVGARTDEGVRPYDEVKSSLREILRQKKQQEKAKTYINDLREKAFVDIRE